VPNPPAVQPDDTAVPPDARTVEPDDTALLIEFLKGRDATCPICSYNLRDLERPVCPECRHPLHMTVGARRVHLGWFIITIAPGIFSGGCAAFLSVVLAFAVWWGGPPLSLGIVAIDMFGILSGIVAIWLILKRLTFMRLPLALQCLLGSAMWAVHISVFLFSVWWYAGLP
jgi:hypothetical protein